MHTCTNACNISSVHVAFCFYMHTVHLISGVARNFILVGQVISVNRQWPMNRQFAWRKKTWQAKKKKKRLSAFFTLFVTFIRSFQPKNWQNFDPTVAIWTDKVQYWGGGQPPPPAYATAFYHPSIYLRLKTPNFAQIGCFFNNLSKYIWLSGVSCMINIGILKVKWISSTI